MGNLIPASAVDRYLAIPAPTTIAAVKSLHSNIRETLGPSYDTFLQGSYRNDTSIPDLNDVDIVAVRRSTWSTALTNRTRTNPISWETIFEDLQQQLQT